jgi:hypothetical protein
VFGIGHFIDFANNFRQDASTQLNNNTKMWHKNLIKNKCFDPQKTDISKRE